MKLLTVFGSLLCASTATAGNPFDKRNAVRAKPVLEKRVANQPFEHPEIQKRAFSFLNKKSKPFSVNGTGVPEVPFDIGESYAGLLPISDDPNETRKLFFWFFPSTRTDTPEEVVIWLNGGPGCSSFNGLLEENGAFTWLSGTLFPTKNSYSWTNLTNVLWVEQPVGVGYSEGTPNITDEVGLAAEFLGFYKNFINTFKLNHWKTYLTGESYAGYYIPYIADAFISAKDDKHFNLAGISVNDPIIGDETIQQQVVILPYVEYWQNLMFLNSSFMEAITKTQKDCGYSKYLDTYFKFPPPKGPFPVLPDPFTSNDTSISPCDVFDQVYEALLLVNPCFNIYHITDTCPTTYSQLGAANVGDYSPPGVQTYFNRTDVKLALHADAHSNWTLCTRNNVFGNGNSSSNATDASPGPANNGVLQRVIEFTNNTIIGSGDLDMLLNTNGTLFAIQNMTWNGVQGLSQYPRKDLYAPYHPEFNDGSLAGAGIQGSWTAERGLTFYTAHLAGHELPGYTAGVAFRMLEILLGHVKDFSSTENFFRQIGDFTGTSAPHKQAHIMSKTGGP